MRSDFGHMSTLLHTPGTHFLVKSYTAFRSDVQPTRFHLPGGEAAPPRGRTKGQVWAFPRSLPSACVKEALPPEGASAPSTCCSLFRERRALHTVLVPLHFRGHHQVRLMDAPELEHPSYSLEMLRSLLQPVGLHSTAVVRSVCFLGALNRRPCLCNEAVRGSRSELHFRAFG